VSDTELLPKSKLEPVRRLEVFTGAGRRRPWTAEQKAQILAESYESGEKVSAVARRHGSPNLCSRHLSGQDENLGAYTKHMTHAGGVSSAATLNAR
jgi:transposase